MTGTELSVTLSRFRMSLEEYRERQRQAYLQRRREREFNNNESVESSLDTYQPSLNESEFIFRENQQSRDEFCIPSTMSGNSQKESNKPGPGSSITTSRLGLDQSTTPLENVAVNNKSGVSSCSTSSLPTDVSRLSANPERSVLLQEDDTSSDALLAQMLSDQMEEKDRESRQGWPISEKVDDVDAAAIAELIASDVNESTDIRIPDEVFQERLIPDFNSLPEFSSSQPGACVY